MDVYLVPLGRGRFEPYFEPGDGDEPDDDAGGGFWSGVRARFSRQLRQAEDQRHDDPLGADAGLMPRLQRHAMRWIAERVAEQRLLWHLGRAREATLHAPEELSPGEAERILRAGLQRDADRHRRQMVIHAAGLVLTLPLVVVPGPNLVGYVFTFTVAGHFLAMRGARHGLSRVGWHMEPNANLSALGRAWTLDAPARHRHVHEAADRLGLRRLATFVERMSAPTA